MHNEYSERIKNDMKEFIKCFEEIHGKIPEYPDWYYDFYTYNGFIVSITEKKLKQNSNNKLNKHNFLEIKVTGKDCVDEKETKKIRLYNYKIIMPRFSIKDFENSRWIKDTLTEKEKGIYSLETEVENLKGQQMKFVIEFDFAEVKTVKEKPAPVFSTLSDLRAFSDDFKKLLEVLKK